MFPISDPQNESNHAIIASKAEPAAYILQTSIPALTTFNFFLTVSFFLLCFLESETALFYNVAVHSFCWDYMLNVRIA